MPVAIKHQESRFIDARAWQTDHVAVSNLPTFTVKEYLALESVAEIKHEYCGERILAMAGAELAHNRLVHNLHVELDRLAEHCVTLGTDQRVLVETLSEYFYPDVLVTCLEPDLVGPAPQSLKNPQIIVEVLSPTTERYDRGDKWSAYRTISTLTDYVMVSSTRREVEHYQRATDGTWTSRTITDGTTTLTNGVVLDTTRLYRQVL